MDVTITPSVWYARIFGIVLTIAGIVGLMAIADQNTTEKVLGLEVNLTHNIIHLASGVLGLVAGFAVLSFARTYALALGIIYGAVFVWGLFDSNPLGLFVNINAVDMGIHAALAVLGIAAWAMSREGKVIETRS